MNSDRFIKPAIVGAVIAGWLVSILVDVYLSIRAGALSVTLEDVIKQGLAALVGFLAKTSLDQPAVPHPLSVTADEPLPVEVTDEPAPADSSPTDPLSKTTRLKP